MEQWNSVKNPPETKVSHREAAHSRGCTSDRRVSAQCYRLRRDGSTGRRSGGGQGFDGLSYHAAEAAHSRGCLQSRQEGQCAMLRTASRRFSREKIRGSARIRRTLLSCSTSSAFEKVSRRELLLLLLCDKLNVSEFLKFRD